jgi:hypothetical protein
MARSALNQLATAQALAVCVSLFAAAGCTPTGAQAPPDVHVRALPPTEADVIEAAIRMHRIDHTVHGSCYNIGHWFDRTLGRELSNLIEGLERGKINWVEVRMAPRRAPSGMYWRAMVMFHIDEDGPDPFISGADFLIRQSDGLVVPSSFKCPGL